MRTLILGLLLPVAAAPVVAAPVRAQRADQNAVTAAEDAFGSTIGNESIGIYSAGQVRGFSPAVAGNNRIHGIYFDRQGFTSPRLVEGSTVRVGISAQGYPFPAPTGIVDFRLQRAGETPVLSLFGGINPYAAPFLEVDAKLPIVPRRLGVAAGVSYGLEEYYDGASARYLRAAVVPRWRPRESVEILGFAAVTDGRDEEAAPTIVTAGDFLPPEIARRAYFGQTWADQDSRSENFGVLGNARLGSSWAISGGVFRSAFGQATSFADLYLGTTRDGIARQRLVADPRQRAASTSGELRASRSVADGRRLHVVHAMIRARDVTSLYGGSASPLDLGERPLGEARPVAPPARFAFGARTRDAVRQWTGGVAYEGRWRGVGELSVGVQRSDYRKTVAQPGLPVTSTDDRPWLSYATAAASVTPALAVYAGYVQGLEESGVAPDNAANRNEALPAIRTRQVDAGVRWAIDERWRVVAGGFQVEKPYFITDDRNVFTTLGDVRHRGAELSLTATPVDALTVVVGAVLMDPRVTGRAVEDGRVGERPVGQADRMLRANGEYRLPFARGWSVDAAVVHTGERPASRSGSSIAPAYTIIDLGARYRFRTGRAPATLRAQVGNVTDAFYWSIIGSNSFGLTDGRRASLTLAVDF